MDDRTQASVPGRRQARGAGEHAVPIRCAECRSEMDSPAVCTQCHSLHPVPAGADGFELLGLPRRYDLDEATIRQKYLALSRHAHPDFHSVQSPEGQGLALRVASAINDAYRMLRDPVERAEYLLRLLGGPSGSEDKTVPQGLLAETMLLREEIEEAREADDAQALETVRADLQRRVGAMVEQLGAMFAEFDGRVGCEAIRKDALVEIRSHLNAIRFLRRVMEKTE